MIRINEIRLELDEDKALIPSKVKKKLNYKGEILEWSIARESIDARKKDDVRWVYSVDFRVDKRSEETLLKRHKGLKRVEKKAYVVPQQAQSSELSDRSCATRPIVVGSGPAGLFAGLVLAKGGFDPIILERGKKVEQRIDDVENFWERGILDPDSNIQFGEGGAGTFSDGKLTTGINDERIRFVLESFVEAGADPEILYKKNPHIGTDVLRTVVTTLRNEIERLGGEMRFSSKVVDLDVSLQANGVEDSVEQVNGDDNLQICGVKLASGEIIETDRVVLAVGHSARDTFAALNESGVYLERKPFSMGVRIEHPQELVSKAQYGSTWDRLPPADYKLACRIDCGRGAYTFCMCPGGYVIVASSEPESIVVNGMSYHARDGKYANSAILVDVKIDDFEGDGPLAGVEFQRKYEHLAYQVSTNPEEYVAPSETLVEFLSCDSVLRKCLPDFVYKGICAAIPQFNSKLHGFDNPNAVLTAIESRSSSPVRIVRDSSFQSNVRGLFPCGEGAGYAGGIMSSAVDGIRVAEAVANRV